MEYDGKMTLLVDGDGARIAIYESKSGEQFFECEISAKDFAAMLGRHAFYPIKMKLMNLQNIGKNHQHKMFEFECPDNDFKTRKDTAVKLVKELCPKGWEPDLYFSSHNSFFHKGKKLMARTTIRRWV